MDAFDADALIYAAVPGHDLGERVRALLVDDAVRVGSTLLVPELLSKPLREGAEREIDTLVGLLSRLDLLACDGPTAETAAALGARYRLRAADAVHLATAVVAGADRFITNNRHDFPRTIEEVEVVYPGDLAAPEE